MLCTGTGLGTGFPAGWHRSRTIARLAHGLISPLLFCAALQVNQPSCKVTATCRGPWRPPQAPAGCTSPPTTQQGKRSSSRRWVAERSHEDP